MNSELGTTPLVHDSRAGLRINLDCQVVDNGEVISGLYCGGESAPEAAAHWENPKLRVPEEPSGGFSCLDTSGFIRQIQLTEDS